MKIGNFSTGTVDIEKIYDKLTVSFFLDLVFLLALIFHRLVQPISSFHPFQSSWRLLLVAALQRSRRLHWAPVCLHLNPTHSHQEKL